MGKCYNCIRPAQLLCDGDREWDEEKRCSRFLGGFSYFHCMSHVIWLSLERPLFLFILLRAHISQLWSVANQSERPVFCHTSFISCSPAMIQHIWTINDSLVLSFSGNFITTFQWYHSSPALSVKTLNLTVGRHKRYKTGCDAFTVSNVIDWDSIIQQNENSSHMGRFDSLSYVNTVLNRSCCYFMAHNYSHLEMEGIWLEFYFLHLLRPWLCVNFLKPFVWRKN